MTEIRSNAPKKAKARKPSVEAALEAGDIQGVIDNLSVRMRRFAEEYLVDFNGSAAVVRAGYNTKYPNRIATQLLAHPGVKAAIDQLTLERASQSVVKPDYVINKVVKTIERAESQSNHTAVLRGCELLARHLGMFIERTEISGPNGDAIKYEQVQDAAAAFTSAIAGLIARDGEGESTGATRRDH